MRIKRILSVVLAFALMLGMVQFGAMSAEAASTTKYYPGVETYSILNGYSPSGTTQTAAGGGKFSATNQTGATLPVDGFLNKNATPYAAWIVEAPEAGEYTFDPAYNVGRWNTITAGVYNMVFSVNDTRYYVGKDLTSDSDGSSSVKVTSGSDVFTLELDKGVNVVRMLPTCGPDFAYNGGPWVDLMSLGVDSRLTVREAAPVTVDPRQAHYLNLYTPSGKYDYLDGAKLTKARQAKLDFDSLCQENLADMPYFSYTVNAPAAGYYDIDLVASTAGLQHGNDGYFIVRVNGTNYRRWFRGDGSLCKHNVSVYLEKGANTVSVTPGIGMKTGTYENDYDGYGNISWVKSVTFYGGVSLAETPIDPQTQADAPQKSSKLEAETYGILGGGFTVSGTVVASGDLSALSGLPTARALTEGAWMDKTAMPMATFLVKASKAGIYTVRPVYELTVAEGADATDYYITGSVNDSAYDLARFEPLENKSRTWGYGELLLELQEGVNVIRLMPVVSGNSAKSLNLDYIRIFGDGVVSAVAPSVTHLQSGDAEYINLLEACEGTQPWCERALSGNTGTVTSFAALNRTNLDQLGCFTYTVSVPTDGYYDLQTYVGSETAGDASLIMLVDGRKQEIKAIGGRTMADNPVNLSAYLEAGDHMVTISGLLGQTSQLGALTVTGGIVTAGNQTDPGDVIVAPTVKEGGLIRGSVYTETNYKLTGIPADTTGSQFKSNFLDNDNAQFFDASGAALTDTAIVTRGCGVLYPNGTYYEVAGVLTGKSARSIGADEILALGNPVGRLTESNSAVHMEASMANFTLTGQLEGDVVMYVDTLEKMDEIHSFYVEVDGKLRYFEVDDGEQTVTLAEDLPAGKHTIVVHKGTDIKKEIFCIQSVVYTGALEKAQAKTRRIEFLGDSITAGSGVFFADCGYGYTQSWFVYANMAADALNAEHYSIANGGWRFTSTYNPSTSIYSIYDKVSMHDASLGEYDFSWRPDVVVINLGTNDAIAYRKDKTNYTQESFAENIKLQLDQVRKNNPDAQIVWVYGAMIKECEEWIRAAVEDYAKTDSKVHYVHLDGNTKGRGDHPDFDGHTKAAGILVDALCGIMGWEVPAGTHATGDCDSTVCEFCIANERTLTLHTYSGECDTSCNFAGCEYNRTAVGDHTYDSCLDDTCDVCGETRTAQTSHKYAAVCDTSCDNEGCGYVRIPLADHDYDSIFDDTCGVCGYKRQLATNGSCGSGLSWSLSEDGILTITGSGDMSGFGDDVPWKDVRSMIRRVVLPEGITAIGDHAFSGCAELTQIRLPQSLTAIGQEAFEGCTSLQTVEIPAGVTEIGDGAFASCYALTDVVLPEGITEIHDNTFLYCRSLASVNIPEGVTRIGIAAFGDCDKLVYITMPVSLKTVRTNAFLDCDGLKAVHYRGDDTQRQQIDVQMNNGDLLDADWYFGCTLAVTAAPVPATGKPQITWEAVEGAQEYILYRATSVNGKYTKLKTLTALTYTDTSAKVGTKYYYKVLAMDGTEPYLAVGYVGITCACAQLKVKVTISTTTGQPTLSWSKVTGAGKYQILRADTEDGLYDILATQKGTSFTDKTAKGDRVYYYKVNVVASKTGANSVDAEPVAVTTGLAKPTLKTAVYENGKPQITWSAVSGAVSYTVYRNTSTRGAFQEIGTTTELSYVDETAVVGKLYYYKLVAVGTLGQSAMSGYKSIRCCADRPEITVVQDTVSGKPAISWEPVENGKKYEVYRATSANGKYTRRTTTTACSYTDTGATPGYTYYYKVYTVPASTAARSKASDVVSMFAVCAQPKVKVSVSTAGQHTLSWSKITGASRYEILRADTADGEYTVLATQKGTSYTDKATTPDTLYYYKVNVIATRTGANSNEMDALAVARALAATTISKITTDAPSGKPVLTWKAVDGAVGYNIYRATSSKGTYTQVGSTDQLTFADTTAQANKTYYYKVTVCGVVSESAKSGYRSIRCKCAAPTVVLTVDNGAVLTWEAVEGARKYEVYRATSETGKYTRVKTTTALTWKDTTAASRTYYYKVKAVAASTAANSAYGNIVTNAH